MRDPSPKVVMELQSALGLHQAGKLKDAEAAYRRILVADPSNADALGLLGMIHRAHGDPEAAVKLLKAAMSLRPAARFAYNLGASLEGVGDIPGCIAAFQQAVHLDSDDIQSWASAIFNSDLHPYGTPAIRLAARRAFNTHHCAALTAAAPSHTNDPDPDRRLRVGYLSADFRDHSAAFVLLPILAGHDHEQVEVFCYWQQYETADRYTARFQEYADHWRVVTTLSDDDLAAQIRRDRIDILIDLSGYSNGNRLLALARKPAPVIMTGWGYATGLGLDACDYLLADAVTVPPDLERHHHERIIRLPCALAFDPSGPYPDVATSPAERNGHVTFGYFGRANKTHEEVWATWAEILHRVPNSRLILKGREYVSQSYQTRISDFFSSLYVKTDRLTFLGSTTRERHLAAYGKIDVALEPWPHNGGVTLLEACLMGVPSVALLGDHLNGRIAASVLDQLGLPWAVGMERWQYVEIAAAMAERPATMAERQQIRGALLDSIICKPKDYMAVVQDEYRKAWREWCAGRVEQTARVLVEASA